MKSIRMRTSMVCGIALLSLAGVANAGIFYRAETTVQTASRSKIQRTTVDAWVDGDKAKVLFRESQNPMTGQGSYLLTQDGGKTLFLVNPEERTYAEIDVEAMIGLLGSLNSGLGGMMEIEFSEPDVEILGEEDGDEILGFETRHYRVRSSFGVKMKVFGMKRSQETETFQDIWVTDEFKDPALAVWLRKDPPSTGDKNLDQIIAAEVGKLEGFPLLTRSVSTSVGGRKGKRKTTTTTTTEVVELKEMKIAPEKFVLPPEFEKTELVAPGLMDSFKAAREES